MNNTFLYLEKGCPTNPDQFRINFIYARLDATDDDAACYRFYDLFELPVESNIKIEDLKELVK